MTNTQSPEPSPEAIIQGLHQIRQDILNEFNGDIFALSDEARRLQEASDREIRPVPANRTLPNEIAVLHDTPT